MFTIGESRPITQANEREQQTQQWWTQQVSGNPRRGRFTAETPQERERRLEIDLQQRRRRRQPETAEQREHRLALRRQRRQQETDEQRNRRLQYQGEYRCRRRLNFNTQSNAGPLSNENSQQREHRLERLRQNFATRIQNETEEEATSTAKAARQFCHSNSKRDR